MREPKKKNTRKFHQVLYKFQKRYKYKSILTSRMSSKQIILNIPETDSIPDEIYKYSPERVLLLIKLGNDCLKTAEQKLIELTQQEIYKKIEEEKREEFKKLEFELILQKEREKIGKESIIEIYETQINQLKKQMDTQKELLKDYELENREKIQEEINKNREKYDILLQEKENQMKLDREMYEKINNSTKETFDKVIQMNKNLSTAEIGRKGELNFQDIAETFKDFNDFEIEDKHKVAGKGDYHLHFEDFAVLADAKAYTRKVDKSQIDKIRNDLLKNEHISFAWLVSMNTSIDKHDKYPIDFEFINTKQCIVYINNLLSFGEPEKFLRIAYSYSKMLYKKIESDQENDDEEITEYKEKENKIQQGLNNLKKTVKEMKTSISASKEIVENLEREIVRMLNMLCNKMDINYSVFEEWWEKNMERTEENKESNSTDLWFVFRNDNKEFIKEFEITTKHFREYVLNKSGLNCLEKSKNGSIMIRGVQLKKREMEEPKKNIVIELKPEIQQVLKTTKKKINKSNSKKEYDLDSETENKLLKEYEDETKDIMIISNENNIVVWKIVSLLVKKNIITKRDNARGYDKYKETDEYKDKLKQNEKPNRNRLDKYFENDGEP